MVYLDNAATTFPKPDEVMNAVDFCQRSFAVNVGRGAYPVATQAAKVVDETRSLLASFVNAANPNRIVFTPSATIAANEVIWGLEWDLYKTVYVSPFEHNAIMRPLNMVCQKYHLEMKMIPFDPSTQEWDKEETERLFTSDPPDYIFLNQISNVTGLILPVAAIASMAKQLSDCTVIVDASQSIGLVDINVQNTDVDYWVFAGHKNLYASWGIGGFILNGKLLNPTIAGGTGSDSLNLSMSNLPPAGFEAGSPNIIAISSLNAALKWLNSVGINAIAKHKKQLMGKLISEVRSLGAATYLPYNLESHTSVLSINVEDYEPSSIGEILGSDYNIAVRTGFHCAPFVHRLIGTEESLGTVRISVGYFNTERDIDAVVNALGEIMEG